MMHHDAVATAREGMNSVKTQKQSAVIEYRFGHGS